MVTHHQIASSSPLPPFPVRLPSLAHHPREHDEDLPASTTARRGWKHVTPSHSASPPPLVSPFSPSPSSPGEHGEDLPASTVAQQGGRRGGRPGEEVGVDRGEVGEEEETLADIRPGEVDSSGDPAAIHRALVPTCGGARPGERVKDVGGDPAAIHRVHHAAARGPSFAIPLSRRAGRRRWTEERRPGRGGRGGGDGAEERSEGLEAACKEDEGERRGGLGAIWWRVTIRAVGFQSNGREAKSGTLPVS